MITGANPGLTSSLPSPRNNSCIFSPKTSSLMPTSLLLTMCVYGLQCQQKAGVNPWPGWRGEMKPSLFITLSYSRNTTWSLWLLSANSTFCKVMQTRKEFEWRCQKFIFPSLKQTTICLFFFALQTNIPKGSSFLQFIHQSILVANMRRCVLQERLPSVGTRSHFKSITFSSSFKSEISACSCGVLRSFAVLPHSYMTSSKISSGLMPERRHKAISPHCWLSLTRSFWLAQQCESQLSLFHRSTNWQGLEMTSGCPLIQCPC